MHQLFLVMIMLVNFPHSHDDDVIDVAIIGAGLAGLTSAYELKKHGINAVVFEAAHRIGGRVQSAYVPAWDMSFEMGGTFINSDHHAFMKLLKDFDISVVKNVEQTAVYHQVIDDEVSISANNFSEFVDDLHRLESLRSKIDVDQISAEHMLERAQVSKKMHSLIEQSIRNEYGGNLREISARIMFDTITYDLDKKEFSIDGALGDEAFSIRGGSEALFKKFHAMLNDQIILAHELISIDDDKDGFVLSFKVGDNVIKKRCRKVVVTVPVSRLREAKIDVAAISQEARDYIAESPMGRNQKLFLMFNAPVWRKQNVHDRFVVVWDFGWIWENSDERHENKVFGLTVFLGGDNVDRFRQQREENFAREAIALLEKIVPGIGDAYLGFHVGTSWQENNFIRGSYSGIVPAGVKVPVYEGGNCFNNFCFAGEAWTDENNRGYMNGAVESAQRAVHHIIRSLESF